MKDMTIVDVVNLIYPGQTAVGNITFGRESAESPIFITRWDVLDVARPTEQSLLDMIPSLQNQFDIKYFMEGGQPQLMRYIDNVAQERQYDSAISCASYIASNVVQWKNDAMTFIAWRDDVFKYTINQIELMRNGTRSVPSFEEFKTELPIIVWPN